MVSNKFSQFLHPNKKNILIALAPTKKQYKCTKFIYFLPMTENEYKKLKTIILMRSIAGKTR